MKKQAAAAAVTRTYKDSVFRLLFQDKKAILELYNALEGANLTSEDEISIKTLENAIESRMYNDLAFQVGNVYIILVEHQSELNLNLPFRMFLYCAKTYERSIPLAALHGKSLVKLPAPRFYVLYNGK